MEVELLFSEFVSERKKPLNLESEHIKNFEREFERIIPASYLSKFENVYLTNDGVAIKNFSVLEKSLNSSILKTNYDFGYIIKKLIKRIRKVKQGVLCFDSWYYGYFHWMTECLPRYYVALHKFPGSFFFIPKIREKYHLDSLLLLGFDSRKLVEVSNTMKVAELLLIDKLAPGGNYNDSVISEMAINLQTGLDFAPSFSKRNIYISRKLANRRSIVNEAEIIQLLKAYDFEIVQMELYDLKDQIQLMRQTRNLISLHGGGLTNMIFMSPGTNVVEIRMESDKQNLCYFSLANSVSVNYYYLFGNRINASSTSQNADLYVNPSILEKVLISLS